MEIWKPCIGYSRYEVSDLGNIRHVKHKKLRKQRVDPHGYKRVNMWKDNIEAQSSPKVHRLVADAFIGITGTAVVDHINGDRTDNRLINLRIVSISENNSNRSKINLNSIRYIIRLHEKGLVPEEIIKRFS